jgi:F-type H+-transporting ATPase subunit epsilon
METGSFRLNIVTPTGIFARDISHIRLRDESGYFGVMKGHIDFLTVLVPSLCYYRDINGREVFLAVDAGIFSIRLGAVTLATREVFESEDAEKLADIIENTFLARSISEESVRRMLDDIEKSFMEKTVELLRSAS